MGATLAAWALFAAPGCLCFVHPVKPPDKERVKQCGEVPCGCRNHVFVFFVQGTDPLDTADLAGVRDYVQSLGFIKTYFGQVYHSSWFADEVRRLCKDDPLARFVVVGYDLGARQARELAQAVKKEGVPLDLLVYLSARGLGDGPENCPENVGRIVSIRGKEFWPAPVLDGAENLVLPDADHFDTPTHAHTLEVLAEELTAVAGRVPVVTYEDAPKPEPLPAPRRAAPPRPPTPDEWDFLEPETQRSQGSRSPAPPPAPKAGPGGVKPGS
jgi:hypothetical protein